MKKILLLLSVLHQPFVQYCVAEGAVTQEMVMCNDSSEQLVVQLDDMSVLDAHRTLSNADYSLDKLEAAFKVAHEMGRPMALINIAHQLSLRYHGTDKLSKLLSESQGIFLPTILISQTNQGWEENIEQIKKNLIESYKVHLPAQSANNCSSAMAQEIVSYVQQVLSQFDNKYDISIKIDIKSKSPTGYELKRNSLVHKDGHKIDDNVRAFAKVIGPYWDIA